MSFGNIDERNFVMPEESELPRIEEFFTKIDFDREEEFFEEFTKKLQERVVKAPIYKDIPFGHGYQKPEPITWSFAHIEERHDGAVIKIDLTKNLSRAQSPAASGLKEKEIQIGID